jgi:serine protease Do
MGYSLAVPINLAREAMNDILIHGHVVRGYMGVSMDPVTQESVRRDGLKMEYPHGVYIKVRPNSPAARAGLKDGDVVLAVDGQKVDHPNQIQSLIYGRDPGEIVQLTLFGADGQDTQLEIVLGEREEDRLLTQGRQRLSHLGLSVERLPSEVAEELGFTLEIAEELGFDPGEIPVIVTEVDPLGPAADKGIRVRDVITEIDQQRVTSMHQFVRSISNLEEGRSALFWFWRAESGIDVRVLRISQ